MLHQDVTYSDLYTYLNCLEISPCSGWMNTNATLRNITTEVNSPHRITSGFNGEVIDWFKWSSDVIMFELNFMRIIPFVSCRDLQLFSALWTCHWFLPRLRRHRSSTASTSSTPTTRCLKARHVIKYSYFRSLAWLCVNQSSFRILACSAAVLVRPRRRGVCGTLKWIVWWIDEFWMQMAADRACWWLPSQPVCTASYYGGR